MEGRKVLVKEYDGVSIRSDEILLPFKPQQDDAGWRIRVLTTHGVRIWSFDSAFEAIVHFCLLDMMQHYHTTGGL